MVVSKQNRELQRHCPDFKQVDNILGNKLNKLSMNINSYCSIRLKLLHNLQGKSLHRSLILNPECHIKLLEENLNLLNKDCCNDYQIRNNSCSLKPTSKSLSLTNLHQETAASSAYLKEGPELAIVNIISRTNEFPKHSQRNVHGSNKTIMANYKNDPLSTSIKNELIKNYHVPNLLAIKGSDDSLSGRSKRQITGPHKKNYCNLGRSCAITGDCESIRANPNNTSNDVDNQFEFTVEQEKIVSFVCSPSPERKQKSKPSTNESNERFYSDRESDELSELSFTESITNTLSEIEGNSSCKNDGAHISNSSASALAKFSTILWHPPLPKESPEPIPAELNSTLGYFPSDKFTKTMPNQTTNMVDNHSPGFHFQRSEGRKRQKSFFNHETILFREASLRGCYDIENMLTGLKTPLPNVEQDLRDVKEAIFSAIRLQRSNDDMISDGVTSVLDICKSWIKLNSHFEREDFKDALEKYGIDLSVFSDFLQWQCISRTLIDKLIHTLKNITSNQSSDSILGQSSKQIFGINNLSQRPSKCNDSYQDLNITHSPPSKNVFSINKHWKQRRFLTNQSKQETSESKSKRLCKSKLTVSTSSNRHELPNRCNIETIFGHGDNSPAVCGSYNCLDNMTHSITRKDHMVVGGQSVLNCNSLLTLENGTAKVALGKTTNFCNTQSKDIYGTSDRLNVCSTVHLNNVPTVLSTSASELQTNQYCPITAFHTSPPSFYSNQGFFVTSNQANPNLNKYLIKPNPIHCIDTDVSEKCIKSSYIKPGSYNPPQKPATTQKSVNNNVQIEDIPVIGIPFLYSSSQSNQQLKSQNTISTSSQTHTKTSIQNSEISSDDTWRAALTLAESFRDTMMSTKAKSNHTLKLSDSVSFQSHFLLSDDGNQQSADNYFRLDNEIDAPIVSSAPDISDKAGDKSVSEVQIKTSNSVIESFNDAISENRKEFSINKVYKTACDPKSGCERMGLNDNQTVSYLNDYGSNSLSARYIHNGDIYSENMTPLIVQQPKTELVHDIGRNDETYQTHSKSKKTKRTQDENLTSYQQRSSTMYRKPKSVFKRAINQQIIEKLEDILDHVWNTEVSNHFAPEKEATKLELKIKSPMYVEAMKFKLGNHSYDTLEQALIDFQQHFDELKRKNQDNKECAAVVNALEKTYLNLVETHFGLMYQPGQQFLSPIGKPPSLKPRRQKKISKRC